MKQSDACERNKHPISEKLISHLNTSKSVLEIGSGTGQHALFFSQCLPHLTWQPSDLAAHIPDIKARIAQHPSPNILSPFILDVRSDTWCDHHYDAIFTANTLHIVAWSTVEKFFQGIARHLNPEGLLCIYGPFRYQQNYTSQSNAEFDLWLKNRDALSGIRDFEAIEALAQQHQLILQQDYALPANNQLLIWQYQPEG